MITFIVFLCYECSKIDYTLLGIRHCSECAGEIKYLKVFNSKEEASNYAKFLRGEFRFVNQTY